MNIGKNKEKKVLKRKFNVEKNGLKCYKKAKVNEPNHMLLMKKHEMYIREKKEVIRTEATFKQKHFSRYSVNTVMFSFDNFDMKTTTISNLIQEDNKIMNGISYVEERFDISKDGKDGIWYDVNTTLICTLITSFDIWKKRLSPLRILEIKNKRTLKSIRYCDIFNADVVLLSHTVFCTLNYQVIQYKNYMRYGLNSIFNVSFQDRSNYDFLLQSTSVNLFAFCWRRFFLDSANTLKIENNIYTYKSIHSRCKWIVSCNNVDSQPFQSPIPINKLLNILQSNASVNTFLTTNTMINDYAVTNIKIQDYYAKSDAEILNDLMQLQYKLSSSVVNLEISKVSLAKQPFETLISSVLGYTHYPSDDEIVLDTVIKYQNQGICYCLKDLYNRLFTLHMDNYKAVNKELVNEQTIMKTLDSYTNNGDNDDTEACPGSESLLMLRYICLNLYNNMQDKCKICLEDIDQIIYVAPCGHAYCAECILTFQRGKSTLKCPLCNHDYSYSNAFFVKKNMLLKCNDFSLLKNPFKATCHDINKIASKSLQDTFYCSKIRWIQKYIERKSGQNIIIICKTVDYKYLLFSQNRNCNILRGSLYDKETPLILSSDNLLNGMFFENIKHVIFAQKLTDSEAKLFLSMIAEVHKCTIINLE